MRIGILGSGAMATALGGAWARAGHEVLVGGRDPGAAARAAAAVGRGARSGTPAEAAEFGEAVLVAVPADAADRVVGALAAELAGRTVLDCTVPMAPGPDGPVATTAGGPDSVAARLAAAAPGARVAKVFGICHESIWTLDRPAFAGAPLAVPFCTDDPAAAALVAELVASMGCTPLPCGGLARAGLLESAAVLAIGIWWSGGEARHAFPAPALAPGAVDDEQL
ncbi:NAD(P)-binding domain-containing protein [Kitasatospora sp. CM 4170]|uniref:NADPH-dependent F420 reductase n=1 Tax=Kitasatospora aburaviensis TaxID=67265 RepID=A0ABW1ER37_9ACTN|nr:NAD(P)-binding domain-containing protein [Kitasatospora sp. CM 4170]WNM44548.1 NAD(P)-binding domain-containing protein [Kitasatospora sp. CM 4170]